jgi:Arabinose efflux permease
LLASGLGFGAVNPATSKGIVDWFTVKWRATAMGIKQTGFTAGTMVAAATLPAIAEVMGWRWAVAIVAGLVILSGISSYPFYPPLVTKKKLVTNERSTIADISGEEPVWKNRRILFWSFLGIFYAMVQVSGTAYLSLYMVDHFLYNKVMAGIFLAVAQGGGTLGRIIWGSISDVYFRKNRHKIILMIGFIAAATCIILGLLPVETHYIIVAVVAAVFGFTAMGYNAVFLTFIGEMAGPENAGQAIGVSVTIAYCGIVIGPPAFGLTADILGYKYAWVIFGGIFAMALAFTFMATVHGSPFRRKSQSN